MNKLNLETNQQMKTENYNELVQICKKGLERISEQAPSDNDVKLSLRHLDQNFIATIKLASLGLMFTLQASARSPFMAVESAMKEALAKVQKWSATR